MGPYREVGVGEIAAAFLLGFMMVFGPIAFLIGYFAKVPWLMIAGGGLLVIPSFAT